MEPERVVIHPFVIGLMGELPRVPVVGHDLVMRFAGQRQRVTSGIGWVDVHLLCAAARENILVWTRDRALVRAARRLGLHPS